MSERDKGTQQKIWHEYFDPIEGNVTKLLTLAEIEKLNHQSGDARNHVLNSIKENSHGKGEAQRTNAKYLANRH